jgi:hypothetical protein
MDGVIAGMLAKMAIFVACKIEINVFADSFSFNMYY